jgi:hypothetical protein
MPLSGEQVRGRRAREGLEQGGTSPEGATGPRARRNLTRGGDRSSSEAEPRPRGRPVLERGGDRAGLKISKALVQTCPWTLLHVDKDESHHANVSMALLHDDRDVADSLSSSFMGQLGALSSEMCTKFGPLLGWALGLRTHRTPSEPALGGDLSARRSAPRAKRSSARGWVGRLFWLAAGAARAVGPAAGP